MSSETNPSVRPSTAALLDEAKRCLAGGLSIVPVHEKLPIFAWGGYRERQATWAEVERWANNGWVTGWAVVGGAVSGNLTIFDYDRKAELWEPFLALAGVAAESLPLQRTGGGGIQLAVRGDDIPQGNRKLAYVRDPESPSGYKCLIETRGEGGYAVIPPSLHPSGGYYSWMWGHFADAPTRINSTVLALYNAALKLDQRPAPAQKAAPLDRAYQRYQRFASDSIIEKFNAKHDIFEMLERNGYSYAGTKSGLHRYIRPCGKTASVVIGDGRAGTYDGKSYHHSANDPVFYFGELEGHWLDPYDIHMYLGHSGNKQAAFEAAALDLGITLQKKKETPAPVAAPTPPAPETTPTLTGERVVLTNSTTNAGLIAERFQTQAVAGPAKQSWPGALMKAVLGVRERFVLFDPQDGRAEDLAHQAEAKLVPLPCAFDLFMNNATVAEFAAILQVATAPPSYHQLRRA